MTFQDIFKSSFLENVSGVSLLDMGLSLVLAFGLGLFMPAIPRFVPGVPLRGM